jgi:hypothetical protein
MARENHSHSIPRKRKEAAASLLPLSASFLFHFFFIGKYAAAISFIFL